MFPVFLRLETNTHALGGIRTRRDSRVDHNKNGISHPLCLAHRSIKSNILINNNNNHHHHSATNCNPVTSSSNQHKSSIILDPALSSLAPPTLCDVNTRLPARRDAHFVCDPGGRGPGCQSTGEAGRNRRMGVICTEKRCTASKSCTCGGVTATSPRPAATPLEHCTSEKNGVTTDLNKNGYASRKRSLNLSSANEDSSMPKRRLSRSPSGSTVVNGVNGMLGTSKFPTVNGLGGVNGTMCRVISADKVEFSLLVSKNGVSVEKLDLDGANGLKAPGISHINGSLSVCCVDPHAKFSCVKCIGLRHHSPSQGVNHVLPSQVAPSSMSSVTVAPPPVVSTSTLHTSNPSSHPSPSSSLCKISIGDEKKSDHLFDDRPSSQNDHLAHKASVLGVQNGVRRSQTTHPNQNVSTNVSSATEQQQNSKLPPPAAKSSPTPGSSCISSASNNKLRKSQVETMTPEVNHSPSLNTRKRSLSGNLAPSKPTHLQSLTLPGITGGSCSSTTSTSSLPPSALKPPLLTSSSSCSASSSSSSNSPSPTILSCDLLAPPPVPPNPSPPTTVSCQWRNCSVRDIDASNLLEHIRAHAETQISREKYACLWSGCKVYNKPSWSAKWLERHVVAHSGQRPFRCILDNCGQRFHSQAALERHVNSHFQATAKDQDKSKGGKGEGTVSRVLQRKRRQMKRRCMQAGKSLCST